MYLSKNINHLRRMRGYTQDDLAMRIDKSKANISAYEKGKILPPIDVIMKFCEIFDVNLDDIVNKDLSKEGPRRPDDEASPRKRTKLDSEGEELIRRLLVQKIEEIANVLREEQPEVYKRLRLDELIRKEKNFE